MSEDRVTVREAADILGLEKTGMVNYYLRTEQLSAAKVGRNNMIPKAEVEALKARIESGEKKPRKPRAKKGEAPTTPAPETTQPQASSEPPTPVTPPPAVPLTEVPVGSVIELTDKSRVWRMDPTAAVKEWEEVDSASISVKVVDRNVTTGSAFLMCRAAGSQTLWSVMEADVLNGNFNLLQTPVTTPQTPPVVEAAPAEPEVEEEPQEDLAKAEEDQRRDAYGEALVAYAVANDLKLGSLSDFNKVSKRYKKTIIDYLLEVGEESEEGKNDRVIEDFDYKAILTFTLGQTVIQHDAAKIIAWALETGHTEVLTYGVNVDAWNGLKAAGGVSAEFVASVESVKKLDDKRKLIINKLKGEKSE